jgi:hypothetical protein
MALQLTECEERLEKAIQGKEKARSSKSMVFSTAANGPIHKISQLHAENLNIKNKLFHSELQRKAVSYSLTLQSYAVFTLLFKLLRRVTRLERRTRSIKVEVGIWFTKGISSSLTIL